MTHIFTEQDASLNHLRDRQIAVLGYGNLGRPIANNLRDSLVGSGAAVIVGNIEDRYAELARSDGFTPLPIDQAVQRANLLFFAMPDEVMPRIYLESVAPYLKTGDMLVFASGYNIAFQYIEPPIFVDVGLIAPRTVAGNVRTAYKDGRGYPTLISLHQRATPQATDRILALALGMGGLRQGAIEVTFKQEVELDLFWQQAILPALHGIFLAAAQVLVREGYPQEVAMLDIHLSGELGELLRQASEQGWVQTLEAMSLTGQYGLLSRTERFQESKTALHMESILDTVRNGAFAREWASEYANGYPRLNKLREKFAQTTLWQGENIALQFFREKRR